jgi:hypothetical protein
VTGVAALAEPTPVGRSWTHVLLGAVRPEFRAEVYVPDPGDRVLCPRPPSDAQLKRGPAEGCAVVVCRRSVHMGRLCRGHHARWKRAGRPPLDGFIAVVGAVNTRHVVCALPDCEFRWPRAVGCATPTSTSTSGCVATTGLSIRRGTSRGCLRPGAGAARGLIPAAWAGCLRWSCSSCCRPVTTHAARCSRLGRLRPWRAGPATRRSPRCWTTATGGGRRRRRGCAARTGGTRWASCATPATGYSVSARRSAISSCGIGTSGPSTGSTRTDAGRISRSGGSTSPTSSRVGFWRSPSAGRAGAWERRRNRRRAWSAPPARCGGSSGGRTPRASCRPHRAR